MPHMLATHDARTGDLPGEEMAGGGLEGLVLMGPPNCTQSGLERDEWLAYYAAWIASIDEGLTKYGAVSLMGDSRGKFQEPTWLVEGIISEEQIRWQEPSRNGSSRTSAARRAG